MEENTEKTEASVSSNSSVRDHLVSTAVHFLKNPNVQKSPESQKRTFLLKKGLTEAEVDLAILLAKNSDGLSVAPPPPPMPISVYQPSLWTRLNQFGSTAIIIGIALYGIHKFYKQFIEPLLYGEKEQDARMSHMEEQLVEVSRSLSQLKKCISNIEETLDAQKQQIQNHVIDKYAEAENSLVLRELKSEVAIIKSLLLNRHQFPEVPKIAPMIPTWQMVGESDPNDKLVEEVVEAEIPDANIKICNGVNENAQLNGTSESKSLEPDVSATDADNNNLLEN